MSLCERVYVREKREKACFLCTVVKRVIAGVDFLVRFPLSLGYIWYQEVVNL